MAFYCVALVVRTSSLAEFAISCRPQPCVKTLTFNQLML